MKCIFVDTENVGLNELEGYQKLDKDDILKIYKSNACAALVDKTLRKIGNKIKANVSVIDVPFTMKNAMDCMIIKDIHNMKPYKHLYDFYIITKDSDYNKPVKELKNNGYNIKINTSINNIPSTSDDKDLINATKLQKIQSVCAKILKDSPFKKHTQWLAKKIYNQPVARIKFDIAANIPTQNQENSDTLYQLLDKIINELKNNEKYDYDEIETISCPTYNDILLYTQKNLRKCVEKNVIKNIAIDINKHKNNTDRNKISEMIKSRVTKKKHKQVLEKMEYCIELIDLYNKKTKQEHNVPKTSDKITLLRNSLTKALAETTKKHINEKPTNEPNQKNINETTIKQLCENNNLDIVTSNKLIRIIPRLSSKSMIKQTLRYTMKQDYEKIYEMITPIISDLPE